MNLTMDYELAKKLKEAGFPQNGNGAVKNYGTNEHIYEPTLPELIDACGERFRGLNYWNCDGWDAFSESIKDDYCKGHGATPEEAVAHLWLALQDKH